MGIIHQTLEGLLGEIPGRILAKQLSAKLDAKGVRLSRKETARLQAWLMDGGGSSFRIRRWQWWGPRKIELEFTDDEVKQIESELGAFETRIPDVVCGLIKEIAPQLLTTWATRWRRQRRYEDRAYGAFDSRLLCRWGPALDLLQMLLSVSREYGETANEEIRRDKTDEPHKVEVVTRLQARACQVTHEILVLLRKGLADGAMARWRTLHEIAVTAVFIGAEDDDLAERYILHDAMESRRAANDYLECHIRLGYEPLDTNTIPQLESACAGLEERFGPDYRHPYGWAAERLGKPRPCFRDIEAAVGMDHLRAHYRLASHNVHANPKGAFYKLGLLGETDLLLAGPSNAGLDEPGQGAAISLVQATIPTCTMHSCLDSLVCAEAMLLLSDRIGEAFAEAKTQLARDSDAAALGTTQAALDTEDGPRD